MQKIIPHLWFDKEAREAAQFYTSVFPEAKLKFSYVLKNTPSGDTDVVAFTLAGMEFMAISAGPFFKINPSVSFLLNFDPGKMTDAREKLDELWEKLVTGGTVLMELGEYPFSKRYGWLQDKYGVSWQFILSNPDGEPRPFITPAVMFIGEKAGKAEEAINFYLTVFKDAEIGSLNRYPAGMEPDKEGSVMFADFKLENQWFAAMDSAHVHKFALNEAISFMVNCRDQAEIDYYWEKLSAVPDAEQCGWLKDKYGVSWQIIPADLEKKLAKGTPEQVNRLTEAFLKMKKFDLSELQRAYEGK